MDDFGNSIMDFHRGCGPYYGFAAFLLCAECEIVCSCFSDQLLQVYGVIV
jgi:hypothetical protein